MDAGAYVRPAVAGDAAAIAAIHNEGIEDRVATFQTRTQSEADALARLERSRAALAAERGDGIAGWATAGPYDDSAPYYRGVGEATVFVARRSRGEGIGRLLLERLCSKAAAAGLFKLTAKVFADNAASVGLFHSCGFTDVGVHRRHGTLDGEWKDVLVLERLLG